MFGDVLRTAGIIAILSIPLGISMWALLDIARRPRWVWAFSGRRQVVWLGFVGFGVATVIGGLIVSGWYLLRVRPELAAVERGEIGL